MNLRSFTGPNKPPGVGEERTAVKDADRCLTLLAEGAALNMPEIDTESYVRFRANVTKLALTIPDRLPDDEKLGIIRNLLHEFEMYRKASEDVLRERLCCWRSLTAALLREVLASLGPEGSSPASVSLEQEIGSLLTAEQINIWQGHVDGFLHPLDAKGKAQGTASLKLADRSTANDNAAGLRGGGNAVEHLRNIMDRRGNGFVVLFRLSCLELISQRFGVEAVQDCTMAVSAFLTSSLNGQDAVYHWSESSLLAILQGRPSEQILRAELQRILSRNRETSINVAGRTIMLRIPLDFELKAIDELRAPEDLFRFSSNPASKW
jgi:GGDEF domain-containing protein